MNYYELLYIQIFFNNFILTSVVSNSGPSDYSPCIDPLSYEVWLHYVKYLYVSVQLYIYISGGGERERDRQTDRQTDRWTDKQTETDRQTDR
jgi:hypothetical protein